MQLAVLSNDRQWEEWTSGNAAVKNSITNGHQETQNDALSIVRTNNPEEFLTLKAAVYIDLLFEDDIILAGNNPEYIQTRIRQLATLLPGLVLVNAVTRTLKDIHPAFCRMNGWNTFIGKKSWEIVCPPAQHHDILKQLASLLEMEFVQIPDIAGMITPRVIAMIVNEGYFALGDQVSPKPEIDTAMKLGTNYPDGPFSWSEKIGLSPLYQLLLQLSKTAEKYKPAPALCAEIEK